MSNRLDELLGRLEELGAIDNPALVEDVVSALPQEDVHALAVKWVRYTLAKRLRGDALAVERRASIRATPAVARREPTPEELERRAARDAEFEAEMAARAEASNRRFWDSIHRATEEFKQALRIEWTAELLDSRFTLPDGTAVTWGSASADQHRERLEMFKRNAIANLEGAARHEQALEELARTGASTLTEAVALPMFHVKQHLESTHDPHQL